MPWSRVRDRRVGRSEPVPAPALDHDPADADAERKKIDCKPPSSGFSIDARVRSSVTVMGTDWGVLSADAGF